VTNRNTKSEVFGRFLQKSKEIPSFFFYYYFLNNFFFLPIFEYTHFFSLYLFLCFLFFLFLFSLGNGGRPAGTKQNEIKKVKPKKNKIIKEYIYETKPNKKKIHFPYLLLPLCFGFIYFLCLPLSGSLSLTLFLCYVSDYYIRIQMGTKHASSY